MIFPLKDGTDWTLTPDKYKLIDERFPKIDIDVELENLKTWLLFNVNRQKTAVGMMRTIGHWMGNNSIPKAQRKPNPMRAKHELWDKQMNPWLTSATAEQIKGNKAVMSMLSLSEFRAWAINQNEVVKEIV